MGAPVRCLDELYVSLTPFATPDADEGHSDVFMDSVNREVSMRKMVTNVLSYFTSREEATDRAAKQIEAARYSIGKQFVLITPGSMGSVNSANDVKIIKYVFYIPGF